MVLVIEDEPAMRSFVADVLRGEGYRVDEAKDGNAGIAAARDKAPALVFTDLKMPGGLSGLDLVRALRALPDAPEVVVLTAYGSVATAVDAMKAGALEFLEKPVSGPDQVRLVASRALERRRLLDDNERLRGANRGPASNLVFADPRMREVLDRLRRVAPTDATVLILGESGVGKEIVARELHRLRFGNAGPFVAVNCAAVPEPLLESELFGHEKGSFTGASERKLGLFEVASGGTLLLDEIGEMPQGIQAKLLRVLETREVTRVGGIRSIATTARIVASTNRDLAAQVGAGRFRQDLYYRLTVVPVTVPPLRDRPGDLDALAALFLTTFRTKSGKPHLALSPAATTVLREYDWPGNVRELRNTLERACILAESDVIDVSDLGLPFQARIPDGSEGLLATLERETILRVLEDCGGNRRQAAQKLGISLRTLQYRLKEYGHV